MFITDFEILSNLKAAEVQKRDFEFFRNERNYSELEKVSSIKVPKFITSLLAIF